MKRSGWKIQIWNQWNEQIVFRVEQRPRAATHEMIIFKEKDHGRKPAGAQRKNSGQKVSEGS